MNICFYRTNDDRINCSHVDEMQLYAYLKIVYFCFERNDSISSIYYTDKM
ncbi:hypothetical protein THOM_2077 [Trachipleistophora hominis]|uniref:Uncharacterized protein n=1 Tax=Trachipleistophora hominis TaxID=72359 RepID=L7JU81_TRAHO|nr:hypothetical protein THOM_2077 [Trachipleistophora hominis]